MTVRHDLAHARECRHLLAWLGSLPVLAGGCTVQPQRADGTPAGDRIVPFSDSLPAGACSDDPDLDDSPARTVLAFDGDIATLPLKDRIFFEQLELFTGRRLPYAMLMYVWDATLPAGSVVPCGRSDRIRKLVVRSGPEGTGQWPSHRRHVGDDFQAAFGQPPGRLVSVGVLTDADDPRQAMWADYGDIALSA